MIILWGIVMVLSGMILGFIIGDSIGIFKSDPVSSEDNLFKGDKYVT